MEEELTRAKVWKDGGISNGHQIIGRYIRIWFEDDGCVDGVCVGYEKVNHGSESKGHWVHYYSVYSCVGALVLKVQDEQLVKIGPRVNIPRF